MVPYQLHTEHVLLCFIRSQFDSSDGALFVAMLYVLRYCSAQSNFVIFKKLTGLTGLTSFIIRFTFFIMRWIWFIFPGGHFCSITSVLRCREEFSSRYTFLVIFGPHWSQKYTGNEKKIIVWIFVQPNHLHLSTPQC